MDRAIMIIFIIVVVYLVGLLMMYPIIFLTILGVIGLIILIRSFSTKEARKEAIKNDAIKKEEKNKFIEKIRIKKGLNLDAEEISTESSKQQFFLDSIEEELEKIIEKKFKKYYDWDYNCNQYSYFDDCFWLKERVFFSNIDEYNSNDKIQNSAIIEEFIIFIKNKLNITLSKGEAYYILSINREKYMISIESKNRDLLYNFNLRYPSEEDKLNHYPELQNLIYKNNKVKLSKFDISLVLDENIYQYNIDLLIKNLPNPKDNIDKIINAIVKTFPIKNIKKIEENLQKLISIFYGYIGRLNLNYQVEYGVVEDKLKKNI